VEAVRKGESAREFHRGDYIERFPTASSARIGVRVTIVVVPIGDEIDICEFSYEKFVRVFFDRPAVDTETRHVPFGGRWIYSNAVTALAYLDKLFRSFSALAAEYSVQQIDQAVWEILDPGGELIRCLWDESAPLNARLGCIHATYFVYADFVSARTAERLGNSYNMWWDLLGDSFWCQLKFFMPGGKQIVQRGDVEKLGADDRVTLDAMFETLAKILELDDPRSKKAALHGLGHLHHPGVQRLIQKYIDENRASISDRRLKWLEQCRDGTVM
jgi:hypothetical protein